MQKSKLLVAVLGTLIAAPALADSPFSANVSLTTDYLFRGMSQTGGKPALQGGFDYANPNGFYAGIWGSNISWISDFSAGAVSSASVELDTYFGYSSSFATDFTYDVGFLRYNYPGNYNGATKADTNEIYGSIGYKWFTAKYSRSLGDTFGISSASGSDYLDLSASVPLGQDFTLGAHYGKQAFKGTTADLLRAGGTDPDYHDYNISLGKDVGGYSYTLMYSKTNAAQGGFWTDPSGRNVGKGTAVLSVSHSF